MLYSANPTVERTVTAKSAVPAAHLRALGGQMNDSVARPMLRRAAAAFFLAGALGALSFWLWVYPEASNLLEGVSKVMNAPVFESLSES